MQQEEMVQIPKAEYEELKELEVLRGIDIGFVKKILKALKNFKESNFKEWN